MHSSKDETVPFFDTNGNATFEMEGTTNERIYPQDTKNAWETETIVQSKFLGDAMFGLYILSAMSEFPS